MKIRMRECWAHAEHGTFDVNQVADVANATGLALIAARVAEPHTPEPGDANDYGDDVETPDDMQRTLQNALGTDLDDDEDDQVEPEEPGAGPVADDEWDDPEPEPVKPEPVKPKRGRARS
jgi:hypothetical protein